MNVETVRRNDALLRALLLQTPTRSRLWSLEHIHAQNSQGLNTVEQWTAWLTEHRRRWTPWDLPDAELAALTGADRHGPADHHQATTFEPLHREIVAAVHGRRPTRTIPTTRCQRTTSEVDSISNLALLARDDNSVLNNAVFEVKRRQ